MNIGELFVTLGIKGQGLGTLKDIGKSIANLPVDAATAIVAMAGISFELSKMAEEAINTAISFQKFGNQTGLSWQELQKWQITAEQANVSAETVASSISQLERNLQEIRLGRGNIAPFRMLGINPVNQNAFQVLDQLRQRIKGLNPAMATNIVSQMGLSPDMMNVLRLSDQQFAQFMNHAHGMTERQEKDFLQAKQALVQFGQAFRYAMFGVVAHFTEAIEKSLAFKNVLIGVGVVAAGLAIYFFPVTAAMVALLLVLEDLAVYFTGGKSVTGLAVQAIKSFFASIIKFIHLPFREKLDVMSDGLERLVKNVEKLASALEKLYHVKELFKDANTLLFKEAFHETLGGGFLTDPIKLFRAGMQGDTNQNSSVVHIHVNSQGPLDIEGWRNVGHMLNTSVLEAHMQVNN